MHTTLSITQLYKSPTRTSKTPYCQETPQPIGVFPCSPVPMLPRYVTQSRCSPNLYYPVPVFPGTHVSNIPQSPCFPVPMFPSPCALQSICFPVPIEVHQSLCSPVPMFPTLIPQKCFPYHSLYSPHMIPRPYVPQCLCSPVPMIPSAYVPQCLCSPCCLCS